MEEGCAFWLKGVEVGVEVCGGGGELICVGMGLTDGVPVGLLVGFPVGLPVGLSVGFIVGATVGPNVGLDDSAGTEDPRGAREPPFA